MKLPYLKGIAAFVLIVVLITSFAACGAQDKNGASTKDSNLTASEAAQSGEAVDPLGKYNPPIEITSAIALGADCVFPKGDDINNNTWTRHYESDLGIKLKFLWTADSSQYEQKVNLAIASNDIPDYFIVNAAQIKMLYESNMIWEMGPVYEKWASADTKEILTQDPMAFKSAHIEGKMMSIPIVDNSTALASLLWIRHDWLRNLNLQVPKNMDELIDIARAFAKQDPDGNGQHDTYGMAIHKDLWGPFASLTGFFHSYHSYPGMWILDENGKVVRGEIMPETRNALLALQNMYKEGLLDKEFGVKDASKVAEDTASGKIGIEYGAWWNPDWPLKASREKDPNADWIAMNIVSVDDKPALQGYSCSVWQYIVVRKDYKNPEAIVKMLNYWFNIIRNPSMENYQNFIFNISNPSSGEVYYKYINVYGWEPKSNSDSYRRLQDAINTGDLSKLTLEEQEFMKYYNQYLKNGDLAGWVAAAQKGPQGSMKAIINVEEGLGLCNLFYGASTPIMAEKMSALSKMMDEVFTQIILGAPIETFDKFVEDWKKLGGDDITREVQEWYEKNY